MFNSVDFQAKAKWLARKTQYKETIQMYENKIRSHNQWIVAKRKKIVAAKAKIQKIDDYKRRKAEYTGKGRKPIFTNALAKLDTCNLLNEINDCEKRISQKKFRINTLKGQLCRAKKRLDQSALCFGGESLFKKQHNLENTEFDSFEEWLAYFNIQRYGSSFWVGAHCETAGNLNAKYDHKAGCFWVKTPKAFEMKLDQIRVPVSFSLEQEKLLLKNQEIGRPVSVRLVKKAKRSRNGNLVKVYDKNKKFLRFETEMFCYVTIETPPPAELKTFKDYGTIGLDLNKDHIALVENDLSGNPVKAYNFPFLAKGCSTRQQEAVLGDHIAEICDLAIKTGKSLVIEDLEFAGKKNNLKLAGKGPAYNEMLSSFLYSKFKRSMKSRARKQGVEVIPVNPAFTSIIGACRFAGYNQLSNHQRAALVIGRRARTLSERSSLHLLPNSTASMEEDSRQSVFHELRKAHDGSKCFWRSKAKPIRDAIRDDWQPLVLDKTPYAPRRPSGMAAF